MKKISTSRRRMFRLIIVGFCVFLVAMIVKVFFGGGVPTPENVSYWQHYNDSLFWANVERTRQNPLGFNDIIHPVVKDSGVHRIAVLGDSFVWGDGLPTDSSWSHKLELGLKKRNLNVEILHWGQNGWSTKDQIKFYNEEGYKYKPDLLILGYVDNDPDMDLFDHMDPNFRKNYSLLFKVWPQGAQKIFTNLYAKSYTKWLKRLHDEENMTLYKEMLRSLKDTLARDSVNWFIVQTPTCLSSCNEYYDVVKPVFEELGIEYIDVYSACTTRLANVPPEQLMSNPVNFHPGSRMTDIFASETIRYMDSTGRLQDISVIQTADQ